MTIIRLNNYNDNNKHNKKKMKKKKYPYNHPAPVFFKINLRC